MDKIKVLVVDDSVFMRRILSDIINSHPNIEVIDTARDGEEAILKVQNLKPHVVTLDVEMPKMDGLKALQKIMDISPVPVLMLSGLTKEGTDATIKALQYGAVDFIAKPSNIFKINVEDMKKQLLDKIIIASKIKLGKKLFYKTHIPKKNVKVHSTSPRILTNNKGTAKKVVAIGTSTGGPRALQTILPNIPKDIDATFVIVQHMPPGFTKSLADRLDSICEINVKEAEQDDILLPGHAYIAPGGKHMIINKDNNKLKISLNKKPAVSGHRPSVDAMMNSLASTGIDNIIGVILTGMGSDGAQGLKKVKENSAYIIAQDEESCVVFGMPKSTIKLGIVDKVLPIDDISDEIIRAVEV
ncbi:protein-glutamate methylesterase/protein-glutamine glutaminase [Paramaledivibacter caminithermalis]|jgi:two-component system chemotaxis response regulator CheB|uniref:Protein-glutamate methylesterase/protein-glutamine glutaminase n=1 Tax=Paramaledivibacter caminithermalis (strain DSM 15212 / CIP 107654 / DViRD3) TaxID=1121301 RepID=A0A1M6N6M3_PARC5|nr:chemotaxis response regulator protein-glutamate methylesterase [Paramaledivibacter caminithermalis]SHJ91342.1 two-component system, chemotaxis family, response regulator CheB [Paramaledivibacter caminithermalis DSM 15212]